MWLDLLTVQLYWMTQQRKDGAEMYHSPVNFRSPEQGSTAHTSYNLWIKYHLISALKFKQEHFRTCLRINKFLRPTGLICSPLTSSFLSKQTYYCEQVCFTVNHNVLLPLTKKYLLLPNTKQGKTKPISKVGKNPAKQKAPHTAWTVAFWQTVVLHH